VKQSDKIYWASALVLTIISILAALGAGAFPNVSDNLRASMFQNLITLDGILFGFSAVMLGLFFPNLAKISNKTAIRCLVFITVSFFGYIESIALSFIGMSNISSDSSLNPYQCVILTIFSLLFSSIYLLMILVDEYFPSEKPK
jgi:hypothetical protein